MPEREMTVEDFERLPSPNRPAEPVCGECGKPESWHREGLVFVCEDVPCQTYVPPTKAEPVDAANFDAALEQEMKRVPQDDSAMGIALRAVHRRGFTNGWKARDPEIEALKAKVEALEGK